MMQELTPLTALNIYIERALLHSGDRGPLVGPENILVMVIIIIIIVIVILVIAIVMI